MKKKKGKWNLWLVLLWGYVTIWSVLICVNTIFFSDSTSKSPPSTPTDILISGLFYAVPTTVFLIVIGFQNLRGK